MPATTAPRPPKTPKSSKSAPKPPRTPKSSVQQKGITKPPKRSELAGGTKTKLGSSKPTKQAKAVSKDSANKDGAEPKKRKESKSNNSEKLVIPTMIDGVDPKTIPGQFTRGRDMQKTALAFAKELSTNGLVDLSLIPNGNQIFGDLTDEQAEHIATSTPIDQIRFSKNSTFFNLACQAKCFKQKVADVHLLNKALAQKQTLTLDAVWAEREYRARTNLSNSMMIRQQAPSTIVSMLEDASAAYGTAQHPLPAKAYKQLEKSVARVDCAPEGCGMDLVAAAREVFPDVSGEWGAD